MRLTRALFQRQSSACVAYLLLLSVTLPDESPMRAVMASAASTAAGLPQAIRVVGAGEAAVNQVFRPRSPQIIPAGFDRTCVEMGW